MPESYITNQYPEDILQDHNKNRHLRILVKDQAELGGGVAELLQHLDRTANDVKDLFSASKDSPSSESDIKSIRERTAKLVETKTIYGIALPLPDELTDSQSHQWSSTEGAAGSILGGIAGKQIAGVSVSKGLGELASSAGMRKPLIDPGYFQDYNGTEPREFSFTWGMVPNNPSEAKEIMSIIYNLKKFTLPKTTINGISLLSPYLFDIQIGNKWIDNLLNMNNVVCKQMDVNYSVGEGLQFYTDGTPKHLSLTMVFAERSTITSNFY